MSDRLPPLTALRGFEAAARHMSFSHAAAELHVTPAALSFQIKSLEEHLGQPVFRRLNRAVELTEAGRSLAPGVSDGFAALTAAWRNTQRLVDASVLTVTSGPAFTAKCLAPFLYEFAQKHAGIDLRLAATLRLLDFERDEVDVAIRFSQSADPKLFSHAFGNEWVTPVMTPELAERYSTPDELAHAPLIHDSSIDFLDHAPGWSTWFRALDINVDAAHGPRFSQADHAIDAALAGGGVALARMTIASKDVNDGRLVAPFALALQTDAQFRFLCAKGSESRPHIAAFLDWLIEKFDMHKNLRDGRTLMKISELS